MDPVLQLFHELEKTQWQKQNLTVPNKPVMTRYDLQEVEVPNGPFTTRTSGSSGIPVVVQKTPLSQIWLNAITLREAVWFKRDFSLPFAVIRTNIKEPIVKSSWGASFRLLGKTGPSYGHPPKGDLNRWLQEIRPGYLMTYPSLLQTIDLSALPDLLGIKTTGETLLERHPLIADTYSAEEVGTIAIQCPDNREVYHVMENIIVEILDESNSPASSGRVVVTDRTSPYIHRYEIGDYAEIGHCACGRGLQTLQKILGRKRNRMIRPDGSTFWPRFGFSKFRTIAPVKRFQLIQTDRDTLEVHLQMDSQLNENQERAFRKLLENSIETPYTIQFIYTDTFLEGKFEPFICKAT